MQIKPSIDMSQPKLEDIPEEKKRILYILAKRNSYQMEILLRLKQEKIDHLIDSYYKRKPLIDELNTNGISVDDIDYLLQPDTKENAYEKAIPILVKWLKRNDISLGLKSSIIHILIDKPISKKYAFGPIIDLYKKLDKKEKNQFGFVFQDESGRSTILHTFIGNAFLKWVDDSYAELIFDMLKDPLLFQDNFLFESMQNFKKTENREKVKKIILGEIKKINLEKGRLGIVLNFIKKFKIVEAKKYIESYIDNSDSETQREVKKILEYFDKMKI